ncbi:L,D-transpeptidase family protein [Bartonella sp. LJL80]
MSKTDTCRIMGRRLFLKSALTASVTMAALPVFANSSGQTLLAQSGRGRWDDQFDAGASGGASVASNQPVLSFATVAFTQQAITQYEDIVNRGGWPRVPTEQGKLQIGVTHPAVVPLRQRLAASGDLSSSAGMSQSFDSYVDAAVKRFQARHGLPADGVTGDFTYKSMNVDAQVRLNQLRINLDRLTPKAELVSKETRFVMVNIPAAQIEAVEDGVVAQRHTAVVGKIDRQTPLLDSKISQIILNPFWTVPKSIIRKDIIPLMQRKPSYLADNNIHLYNNKGEEVSPESVNWHSDDAVNLMFRQDPGKINAMSSTKINFANPYAVYMHDTPQQTLFNNLMRFDSSGCIRIQNIRDLNQWILKNTPGWDRQQMESVIASRKNTPINIPDPIPLHFVYISAWSTGEGVTQFRDDIYHMDGSAELALDTAG